MRIGALCVALLAAGILLSPLVAHAIAPGYTLDWWTVDNGGTTSSVGGRYALNGAIGQPDAGMLSGAGYTLGGGFWGGAAPMRKVYLPLVVR
jgi:hypothetical protein